jgi:hypothetical protein
MAKRGLKVTKSLKKKLSLEKKKVKDLKKLVTQLGGTVKKRSRKAPKRRTAKRTTKRKVSYARVGKRDKRTGRLLPRATGKRKAAKRSYTRRARAVTPSQMRSLVKGLPVSPKGMPYLAL